jgi:hypothetical protein
MSLYDAIRSNPELYVRSVTTGRSSPSIQPSQWLRRSAEALRAVAEGTLHHLATAGTATAARSAALEARSPKAMPAATNAITALP